MISPDAPEGWGRNAGVSVADLIAGEISRSHQKKTDKHINQKELFLMNATRTATQRLCRASAALALSGAALSLSACGGGGAEAYQQPSGSSLEVVQISKDGSVILADLYRDEGYDETTKAAGMLEDGKLPADNITVENTGQLNDAEDTIIWDDGEMWDAGDTSEISMADDMITFDGDTLVPFDSDTAEQQRAELDERDG